VLASTDDGAHQLGRRGLRSRRPSHGVPVAPASTDTLYLATAAFTELPGWTDDHHAAAVVALQPIVRAPRRAAAAQPGVGVDRRFGHARDWGRAVARRRPRSPTAMTPPPAACSRPRPGRGPRRRRPARSARSPPMTSSRCGPSRTRKGPYQTPIYARPPDSGHGRSRPLRARRPRPPDLGPARSPPPARWCRSPPAPRLRRGALARPGPRAALARRSDSTRCSSRSRARARPRSTTARRRGSSSPARTAARTAASPASCAPAAACRAGQGARCRASAPSSSANLPGLDALTDGKPVEGVLRPRPGVRRARPQGVVLTNQRSGRGRSRVHRRVDAAVDRHPRSRRFDPPTAPPRGRHLVSRAGHRRRDPLARVRADLFWGATTPRPSRAGRPHRWSRPLLAAPGQRALTPTPGPYADRPPAVPADRATPRPPRQRYPDPVVLELDATVAGPSHRSRNRRRPGAGALAVHPRRRVATTATATEGRPDRLPLPSPRPSRPAPALAHFEIVRPLGQGRHGRGLPRHRPRARSPGRASSCCRRRSPPIPAAASACCARPAPGPHQPPHVCHIYFIGEERGQLFFAMEYVDGETVAQRLERGPLPPDEALELTRMAALGCAMAQRHGFTHRDVKPSNLMVDGNGRAQVNGTSAWSHLCDADAPPTDAAGDRPPPALVGNPALMAPPSRARAVPVDSPEDILRRSRRDAPSHDRRRAAVRRRPPPPICSASTPPSRGPR